MFNVYELGSDWTQEGVLISSHKTQELAEKRIMKEAKKRVKTVYYIRKNYISENHIVYDYGLWNRFLVLRYEEDK